MWEGCAGADSATVGRAIPAAGAGHRFPPPGWPSKAQVDYAQAIIILVLLILASPWIVSKLLTNPGAVLSGMGRRVLPL
ncbi:MAG: hypothetical protein ACJ75S_08635 [Solirubrobacterales bacterium]